MDVLKIPGHLRVESRTVRFMLYTLFSLIVADGLITKYLVVNGHALELNPFLRTWAAQELFVAIKVSGAFLATLFLWLKYNSKPKLIYTVTVLSLIFYTAIIFWNLFVFLTT